MLPYMRQLSTLPEPPQLQSYLQRRLAEQYRIEPQKQVDFIRPGYRFTNGIIQRMHLSMNAALVSWVDEKGQRREAVCGLEFIRPSETKKPISGALKGF